MLRFVTEPKNKVTIVQQIPLVRNQNFLNSASTLNDSEFHRCMRNVFMLCRWLGLFPVEGLERNTWNTLKFNLKSFYGVYYVASIVGQMINAIVSLIKIFQSGATLSLLTGMVFYFNGIVSTLLLLRVARNWYSLVDKAAALEKASGIRLNKRTSKKVLVLAYTINIFALVEHCLSLNYFIKYIIACYPKYGFSEVMKTFLFSKMPYKIAYSNTVQIIVQIYLEVSGKQATFLWSFMDVVIISMSLYLTEHFEKLNKVIFAGKNSKSTNWRKLRKCQGKLVQLVHLINNHFNYLVLVSCFRNMYFLCVHLYNTFRTVVYDVLDCDEKGIADVLHGFDHHAYFFFSFTYLMLKTMMVSHMAANLNAVAQEPLSALGDIHSSMYSIEIRRFYCQINYTTIGVFGVFFYITRATILKVISSVVTYELMLIQINNRKFTNHLSAFHTVSTISNNNTMMSLYFNGNISTS